jgi:hypothetical protein
VLWWTLERLARAQLISSVAILCWEDQLAPVQVVAQDQEASVLAKGPRVHIAALEAVNAARRWADGWRGGLLGTCEFDRGFHAPWVTELMENVGGDGALLIDPSSAFIDGNLIDRLIVHARQTPDRDFFFSQAAPGLSGVLLRPTLLRQLAQGHQHPGRFLGYMPSDPRRDPASDVSCASVPTPVARTLHRFTLDSDRQLCRAARATASLNGDLPQTSAEQLVAQFDALGDLASLDSLPREVVLELNVERQTRPIFSPASQLELSRPPLNRELAGRIFSQLGACDDVRLTFAGVGDPLLHPMFFEFVEMARQAGIDAIHVETDFVGIDADRIRILAASPIDVVSVHIPAVTAQTYQTVMGFDALMGVIEHVRTFVQARAALGRATPLLAPVFTKCAENLAEMESWYDKWIAAAGSAVIDGASDYAGQIAARAVADMAPPRRRPCVRASKRLTIHSDGKMVSCELDVLARQPLGQIGLDTIADVWSQPCKAFRSDHAAAQWDRHPLCAGCKDWHRP